MKVEVNAMTDERLEELALGALIARQLFGYRSNDHKVPVRVVDLEDLLDELHRLRAELRVRTRDPEIPRSSRRIAGRTRRAYICGFEDAWRGHAFRGVYADSTSDYATAENRGFSEGTAAVRAAIDAAIAAKE